MDKVEHGSTKNIKKFWNYKICSKCAGEHESEGCDSNVKRCINCINANKYLTKKKYINHCADDLNKCETYKVKWEQFLLDTNYPWKPQALFSS